MHVDMTPREFARTSNETMACYVEAEHFLKTGCRGRIEARPEVQLEEGDVVVDEDGIPLGVVARVEYVD